MPTKKDLDRFRGEIGESIVAHELLKRGWNVKPFGDHQYWERWKNCTRKEIQTIPRSVGHTEVIVASCVKLGVAVGTRVLYDECFG